MAEDSVPINSGVGAKFWARSVQKSGIEGAVCENSIDILEKSFTKNAIKNFYYIEFRKKNRNFFENCFLKLQ